jgi:hypothetical protein
MKRLLGTAMAAAVVGITLLPGCVARETTSYDLNLRSQIQPYPDLQNDLPYNQGKVSRATQICFGFVVGGPLGAWLSPKAYERLEGNVVPWVLVGILTGAPLWYAQLIMISLVVDSLKKTDGS